MDYSKGNLFKRKVSVFVARAQWERLKVKPEKEDWTGWQLSYNGQDYQLDRVWNHRETGPRAWLRGIILPLLTEMRSPVHCGWHQSLAVYKADKGC